MDFFPNGDLQTYLGSGKKLKEKVSLFIFLIYFLFFDKEIIRLIFQIASGLEVLHKEKMI
jgi:hypothetical protein